MDHWPANSVHRQIPEKTTKKGARSEGRDATDEAHPYPLARQGAITAATLVQNGRRFDWAFLAQTDSSKSPYVNIHT